MKKFSALKEQIKTYNEKSMIHYKDRDSFVSGDFVSVGDIVKYNGNSAEVLDVGTNHVTLVSEGKTFKCWPHDIVKIAEAKKIPPKISEGKLTFRGYSSRNLSESDIQQFSEAFDKCSDIYAYFNCVVLCDRVLGATPKSLIESFDKYYKDHERATKYADKIGISIPKLTLVGEALEIVKKELK